MPHATSIKLNVAKQGRGPGILGGFGIINTVPY